MSQTIQIISFVVPILWSPIIMTYWSVISEIFLTADLIIPPSPPPNKSWPTNEILEATKCGDPPVLGAPACPMTDEPSNPRDINWRLVVPQTHAGICFIFSSRLSPSKARTGQVKYIGRRYHRFVYNFSRQAVDASFFNLAGSSLIALLWKAVCLMSKDLPKSATMAPVCSSLPNSSLLSPMLTVSPPWLKDQNLLPNLQKLAYPRFGRIHEKQGQEGDIGWRDGPVASENIPARSHLWFAMNMLHNTHVTHF